jgi:hypothetical protein
MQTSIRRKSRSSIGLTGPSEVYSAGHLLRTQQDECKLWMNRLYFSKYTKIFYVILMILCLLSILWSVIHAGKFPNQAWYIALEVTLSVLVLCEVLLRVYLQGCTLFWRAYSNIFDVLVMVLSIFAIVMALSYDQLLEDVEGIAAQVVMAIRLIVQYLRLILLIKNQRKAQVEVLQMIDFSKLAEGHEGERNGQKQSHPYTDEGDLKMISSANNYPIQIREVRLEPIEEFSENNHRLDISDDLPLHQ